MTFEPTSFMRNARLRFRMPAEAGYGVGLSVALGLDCLKHRGFLSGFVGAVLVVEDQSVIAAFRHADPVIRPCHRGEVAYKQQTLL